ncbi:UDP-N-acetylmuramoyl-tripeptide--D-alanyl-D-alanine ligase [Ruminococcaceae bacterium BL-4]|jgi:UDP-N-acetylmuramoyl-tripeptide--D-alanyl-D-alanine ligase|nr:UDP-N-acetylmuramoyl-tripeptide--D-alanyl-D-alanine ligase [Ruminococcaceae bacterium BL-4]
MQMTVKEVAEACGGKILCGDPEVLITSVCTDSRQAGVGSLFVPIRGEHTDAHIYIPAVFKAGAVATFTQNHQSMHDSHVWIAVPDTLKALQTLAGAYRKKFSLPVIGITGSVGKTTTKEMVALALSSELKVMKTQGNQNSQVGLPLTMFQLEENQQAAVIEMGMSQFGEMGRLAQIAAPKYAVMTNIGISHIENLHTQKNILEQKLHITDQFQKDSVLFLNGDDPLLASLRGKFPFEEIYVGTSEICDYKAKNIQMENGHTCFLVSHGKSEWPVDLPVLGTHHVINAMLGIAVAEKLGVSIENAICALKNYHPLAMRQQIHEANRITIIDDSYNASPDAVKSSLEVLSSFKKGRRVAALADMLELGECSQNAHFECGIFAAKSGVDFLVTVGERSKETVKGALSVNSKLEYEECETNEQAVEALKQYLTAGDTVLVKGSRSMHTDEIVRALL